MTLTQNKKQQEEVKNKKDQEKLRNKVNSLWKQFKEDTKFTQTKMGEAMGMNQSAFAQYLRGKENGGLNINSEFLLRFAKVLKINPSDIDPDFGEVSNKRPLATTIEVKGSTLKNGDFPPKVLSELRTPFEDEFLVKADGPLFKSGTYVICSYLARKSDPREVVLEEDGHFILFDCERKKDVFLLSNAMELRKEDSLDDFAVVLGTIRK